MPRTNASAKPAAIPTRPESGPAALLRAIGVTAVQVAPNLVALQTKKRAA